MSGAENTKDSDDAWNVSSDGHARLLPLRPSLIVVHAAERGHLGEAFVPLVRGQKYLIGRGPAEQDDPHPKLLPLRQRPGHDERRPPFADEHLSRAQLTVTWDGDALSVERLGKRELLDGQGRPRDIVSLLPGDLLEVRGRLLLLCVLRPPTLPPARNWKQRAFAFGDPDPHGLVGESSTTWKLRDAVAFVAARGAHVLLLGESGAGKEIVAGMIHELSTRRNKRLVSRNAATLPSGLIEAELFGHVANYPNVGMPERPGLVATADGSTLFLDEIGELPVELQSRLLRVLDDRGEYQRLGDPRPRSANFRLIAATNRPKGALKHDLLARLPLRIEVPAMRERPEDVPLLARHLLRRAASQDPEIGERFFDGWDGRSGEPRLSFELVRALVTHSFPANVRELDTILWASLASSAGGVAELTEATREALSEGREQTVEPRIDVRSLDVDTVRTALERAGWVKDKAWRDLGLANRHVLKRLVKKFGLDEP